MWSERGTKDLWQISSEEILYPIVKDTIDCNVKIIEDYKKGKTNAIKTIIGIVMKKTSGKANGNVVNKIISDICTDKQALFFCFRMV